MKLILILLMIFSTSFSFSPKEKTAIDNVHEGIWKRLKALETIVVIHQKQIDSLKVELKKKVKDNTLDMDYEF